MKYFTIQGQVITKNWARSFQNVEKDMIGHCYCELNFMASLKTESWDTFAFHYLTYQTVILHHCYILSSLLSPAWLQYPHGCMPHVLGSCHPNLVWRSPGVSINCVLSGMFYNPVGNTTQSNFPQALCKPDCYCYLGSHALPTEKPANHFCQ